MTGTRLARLVAVTSVLATVSCTTPRREVGPSHPASPLAAEGVEPPSTPQEPPTAGAEYTCPMHPEVVRSGPGTCPSCGMALEPRKIDGSVAPVTTIAPAQGAGEHEHHQHQGGGGQ